GSTMIGAAIAGALVATAGAANAVAVDAVSFGVCAVLLMLTTRGVGMASRTAPAVPGEQPASYLSELRDGWGFLRHDAVLMSLCLMIAVTNLLDLAWSAVLLPVWARESGAGVAALGLVFADRDANAGLPSPDGQ